MVTDPALDETATEPLYVPAAKLPGFTATEIEEGVVPLVRLTESHDQLDTASVNEIALPVLLVTDKLWAAGELPPC